MTEDEDDDLDLIEPQRPAPPAIVQRMERIWQCEARALGPGWGGLWAFLRDGRTALAFMALGGLTPAAWAMARQMMALSGKPLVVVIEGQGWARITDPSPPDPPPLGPLRPV